MSGTTVEMQEADVVKLVLEFLQNRDLAISMLSLERETGLINGMYSDDILFLRQLILDGQWDDALDFVQPLEDVETFNLKQFQYLIMKHKYLELLCLKSEPGPMQNHEFTVDEVVSCLNILEKYCPTKDEYSNLCLLLTLPRLADHIDYTDWNPSNARVQCFKDVYPLVEKLLPMDKKVSITMSKHDRLVQLLVKGLLYESCVEYCQLKATSSELDPANLQMSELMNGGAVSDADLSLMSWLQCIPHDTFGCPFEQKSLKVDMSPLKKPTLEASWSEQILVTPIKPKMFPHSAMPPTRPRSAELLSRSLNPQMDGLSHGLFGTSRSDRRHSNLSRSFGMFHMNSSVNMFSSLGQTDMTASIDKMFEDAATRHRNTLADTSNVQNSLSNGVASTPSSTMKTPPVSPRVLYLKNPSNQTSPNLVNNTQPVANQFFPQERSETSHSNASRSLSTKSSDSIYSRVSSLAEGTNRSTTDPVPQSEKQSDVNFSPDGLSRSKQVADFTFRSMEPETPGSKLLSQMARFNGPRNSSPDSGPRNSSADLYTEYQKQRIQLQEQLAQQEKQREVYAKRLQELESKKMNTPESPRHMAPVGSLSSSTPKVSGERRFGNQALNTSTTPNKCSFNQLNVVNGKQSPPDDDSGHPFPSRSIDGSDISLLYATPTKIKDKSYDKSPRGNPIGPISPSRPGMTSFTERPVPQPQYEDVQGSHEGSSLHMSDIRTPQKTSDVMRESVSSLITSPTKSPVKSQSGRPRFIPVSSLEDVQAIRSICFHPDGHLYAVGSNSKSLRICTFPDISKIKQDHTSQQTNVVFKRNKHHKGSIYCIAWSKGADLIATGSNDKTVRVMRFNTETCNVTESDMDFTFHDGTIRDLIFMQEGQSPLLVSGGAGDCRIYVTDVQKGIPVRAMAGHKGHIYSLYQWGSHMCVSGGQDNTCHFWDVRTSTPINIVQCPQPVSAFASVSVDPSGQLLASGHENAMCMLYDIRGGKPLQLFRPHSDEVRTVRFSLNAYYLLTGSYDQTIMLTDLRGDLSQPLPSVIAAEHDDKIIQCRWHPHQLSFLSTSADRTVNCWALPSV